MATIFIAGSIKIKNLDKEFIDRITNAVSEGHKFVVGDANGADTSIQEALKSTGSKEVTIFCTGDTPRNNIGNWLFQAVHSTAPEGSREYFSAKDKEMARVADFGLMMWDAASTGTLSNAIELIKNQKKCVVFVKKKKEFFYIRTTDDLWNLIKTMSESAKFRADKKIGFTRKISSLENPQLGLPL